MYLAIAISLLIHGGGFGVYRLGQHFHVWEKLEQLSWFHKSPTPATPDVNAQAAPELQLTFVDVNPQTATTEPPPNAKFYSNKNSQATNPDADKESDQPKITGTQTQITKAEDVPRSPFDRLQPVFPKAAQDQAAEQAKPKVATPPGDLSMAKPESNTRPGTGTAEQSRPRTIKEALARQNRNQLVGDKMKQDGGVRRRLEFTALDAKATPFGQYDAALVEAVEQRWFTLLETMSYDGYRSGRVIIQFHLTYDGRVTDMKILENDVGDTLGLLCWKAVADPAPYEHWPRDLRLLIDKDFREMQFAFYY